MPYASGREELVSLIRPFEIFLSDGRPAAAIMDIDDLEMSGGLGKKPLKFSKLEELLAVNIRVNRVCLLVVEWHDPSPHKPALLWC